MSLLSVTNPAVMRRMRVRRVSSGSYDVTPKEEIASDPKKKHRSSMSILSQSPNVLNPGLEDLRKAVLLALEKRRESYNPKSNITN